MRLRWNASRSLALELEPLLSLASPVLFVRLERILPSPSDSRGLFLPAMEDALEEPDTGESLVTMTPANFFDFCLDFGTGLDGWGSFTTFVISREADVMDERGMPVEAF